MQEEKGADEKERGIKDAVKLVVACGDGSEMFETVKQPFDTVSGAV